ncbi:putative adenylate/guanylate cyclase [Mycobacteroides abscessus subsp. abscessus]|uniref:Putative adenylate/guanylate cyclase n=1 Tax=Mycolicibacterium gilvum (strain PYR-GCK) TaxID=350054 RepID=A4TFK2_MYCGI|nr:putative adenylate/guanylate cyclase [Mycolicibacterium gilvum PYR-GCK]SIN32833.1 putative adenylate/guanylate cyclase [Mycobacteroides abscessus subsp. abscessus]SKX54324.1 putative adenylate/guanylate cyclase [Mycobacteroides abscessus subsp. abscessus]
MLVSSRPTPLVTTMLDLIDSASANDLPSLRIGVASGSAVSRAGDWFGNPVNLASRVSAAARPGAVLVGLHAGDRRRRRPPVVVRRRISSEGRQQQGQPVSGAARPGRPSKAPV